ncbi:hypothetical protein A9Q99_01945 [Gammaproteobacteria bacterium 45_16_T64]|nr:hypothetical protein A9Q99_01945 [Gammaproteobacteria bacterium 45_16_T64]
MDKLAHSIEGSLLGLMAGDSIGLPYEGLSTQRTSKMMPTALNQQLIFGKGMVSDDTEHAVMTAASLAATWGKPSAFQANLAWRLRWWLFRLPAGIGLATGRSILKLWLGVPRKYAGVYSAGNGPCMRAPIIGVCLGNNKALMAQVLKQSTYLTHTDPKAQVCALAVALAAFISSRQNNISITEYREELSLLLVDEPSDAVKEFEGLLDIIEHHVTIGDDESFLKAIGQPKGVSGYSYHTIPAVLYLWFRHHQHYAKAIENIIRFGGDTDTTAAILGGIIGARGNIEEIPKRWLDDILDWPITHRYITTLSNQLHQSIIEESSQRIFSITGPLVFLRNMVFLSIVLGHGFRRLLPPY